MDKIRQDAMRLLQSDSEFREEALRLQIKSLPEKDADSWLYRELLIMRDPGFQKFNVGDEVLPKNYVTRKDSITNCTCKIWKFDELCPFGIHACTLSLIPEFFRPESGRVGCQIAGFDEGGVAILFFHPPAHHANALGFRSRAQVLSQRRPRLSFPEAWSFMHSSQIIHLRDVPEEDRWWNE